MEIRQIGSEERSALMFPLQGYGFESSPWTPDRQEANHRRMRYLAEVVNLVAEEDGRALACVAAYPMRQNVRGVVRDMAGIASVVTDPSARRRGLIRVLLWRLLRQMTERGCAVSALYPFRPSFYGRFGFVGLPNRRTARFAPEGLAHLVRADLPGEVERLPMSAAFDELDAFRRRLQRERHGFATFDPLRTSEFRESVQHWVALARVDGEVVGAVTYRITGFGGDLVATDLLSTGVLGRSLLLQFFARHVDQVTRIVVHVGAGDVPELWGTDLSVTTEGRVDYPVESPPMARVLDLAALSGSAVGTGSVTVEVTGDELVGGVHRLTGDGGTLVVSPAAGAAPQATLSVAGLSGLVYGVLDPVEVVVRGLGDIGPAATATLGELFPRELPTVIADF